MYVRTAVGRGKLLSELQAKWRKQTEGASMFCSTLCRGFAFFQSRVALQSADVVFRWYLCVRRGVVCKGGRKQGGPGPPTFGTTKNKCVLYRRTIQVCANCSWQCPGTSAPSAAHLMVFLYLCSLRSNARGEARAFEGHCVSSRSPSSVQTDTRWEELQRIVFSDEGSLIYPPGNSMIFTAVRC